MKRLAVYLNTERVGVLTDDDEPSFAYDAGWLAGNTALPISRQLPLRGEPFSGRAVRAFFAGLLPEAEPRERIAAILGISEGNDFAMLERIGGECAGARVRFPCCLRTCLPRTREMDSSAGWMMASWRRSLKNFPGDH